MLYQSYSLAKILKRKGSGCLFLIELYKLGYNSQAIMGRDNPEEIDYMVKILIRKGEDDYF